MGGTQRPSVAAALTLLQAQKRLNCERPAFIACCCPHLVTAAKSTRVAHIPRMARKASKGSVQHECHSLSLASCFEAFLRLFLPETAAQRCVIPGFQERSCSASWRYSTPQNYALLSSPRADSVCSMYGLILAAAGSWQ